MAAKSPPGLISAALSSVYWLCKDAAESFSAAEWDRQSEKERNLGSVPTHIWPRINEVGDFENFIPFIISDARIIPGRALSVLVGEDSFVLITGEIGRNSARYATICLYRPYYSSFCPDRWRSSESDIYFPGDPTITIVIFVELLVTGKIRSYVTTSAGMTKDVPAEFWLTPHSEDVLKYDVSTVVYINNEIIFGKISISKDDIDSCFEIHAASFVEHKQALAISKSRDEEPVVRKGRPPKYSEAHFHAEVSRLLHIEGYPERLADLVHLSLDAYVRSGHPGGRPSEEWAEDKLRPTWSLRPNGEKS